MRLFIVKTVVLLCSFVLFISNAEALVEKGPLEFKKFVLLIDVSGSMEGRGDGNGNVIFPKVKKAINGFISAEVPAGSRINVVGFGEKILINKEFLVNQDADKEAVYSFVEELQAVGKNTNIYGTLDYAFKEAESLTTPEPFMILLFTDGIENVNEKGLEEILVHFKKLKQENPFLFVYYYHLTTKPNPDLEKLGENFIVKKFDPNSDYFQEQLTEFLRQSKLNIESRLGEINEKHQALLSAQVAAEGARVQADAARAQAEAARVQAETEKKQAASVKEQAEAERLQAAAEKLQAEAARAEAVAAKAAADAAKAAADAAKIAADAARELAVVELEEIAKKRKQEAEIASLLENANALRKEGSRESLSVARQKYKSILEIDPNRLAAIDGLKEVDNEIWKLKGHFEKYWVFYLIAFVAMVFLALVIRYVLASTKPAPIVYRFSYWLDGKSHDPDFAMDVFFPRKLFVKVGEAKYIGSESGDIMIEHPSVSSTRHARFFRSGGLIKLEREHGYIFDLLGAQQASITLSDDESLYLGESADCGSLERDCVKINLKRIS